MADFPLPPLDRGERFYRALLRLYPARFRREFTQDLVETFRDQQRDAARRGTPAVLVWLTILRDLITQAFAERLSLAVRRRPRDTDEEDSTMAAVPYALRFAELRFAVRRLARVPGFTGTTIFVLALGIGATTAVFSVVSAVLLRPLPYPASDRLVSLGHTLEVSGIKQVGQSDASFLLYERRAHAFESIAATRDVDVNLSPEGVDERAERVPAAAVTSSLLEVLRTQPAIGRGFRTGEDRAGAPPVVILSHAVWARRFGADPAAIGRHIDVSGVSREIIGVMPAGFAYPSATTALWIPMALDPLHADVGSFNYAGIARLRDGMTMDGARADLKRALPGILDEFPSEIPPAMWASAHVQPVVSSLRDSIVGDVSRLLWILLGSVSLVLAIACANVANLVLVRGDGRRLELAVRSALGSGLAGIVAQYLSESALLAASGGVLGVMLAVLGVRLLATVGGGLGVPRLQEVSVDGSVLLFALGLSALCAVFVSLVPVLRARSVPVFTVLREAGRGSTGGARRRTARSVLVVAQVALALVLVAGSGLLARSFARLRTVQPGFDASGLVMSRVALPSANYTTGAAIMHVYDRLLEQVRAVPGVRDATLSTWVPLTADHDDTVIGVEDLPLPPNAVPRVHFVPSVDAHFFRTMGIPLLAGRTLGTDDVTRPLREVVVSRAFAERYWPGASPLGKRVRPGISGEWYTIVGEVGDVHLSALDLPAEDAVYFPLVSSNGGNPATAPRFVALLVRTAAASSTVIAAVRQIAHSIDPALPTYDERTLLDVVSAASARARVTLLLLAIASAVALILGAVGIYGVMAYGVSLRQREIGVRLALGARPADVSRMIARNGAGLAAIGVAIGVVCALGVTRFLRGLLYDVSPTDPMILGATCALLFVVALLASWIPARRAAAVDPSQVLRRG